MADTSYIPSDLDVIVSGFVQKYTVMPGVTFGSRITKFPLRTLVCYHLFFALLGWYVQ